MKFLHPSYLWWLLLLLIPIVVHFVNFRRQKTVLFSDISLLERIKSLNQRQEKLVERLLLLFRLLSLLFLILAFAQPFFNTNDPTQQTHNFSIYIDNSGSMSWQGESNVSKFSQAKNKALEIIKRASPQDLFNIHTNTRHPNQWRWLDPVNAQKYIATLQNNGAHMSLSKVYKRMLEVAQDKPQAKQILLSDFQKSNLDSLNLDNPTSPTLVRFGSEKEGNVYFGQISLVGAVQSGTQNKLSYTINLLGDKKITKPETKIYINGELKGSKSFNFTPSATSIQDTLLFESGKNGWNQIMLTLSSSGFVADDTARLACFLSPNYRVLLCHQSGLSPYLQTVFTPEEKILTTVSSISNLSSHLSTQYNMVVLDNLHRLTSQQRSQLDAMAKKGASMIFFPSENMDLGSINTQLAPLSGVKYAAPKKENLSIVKLNADQLLWKNIFSSVPRNLTLPKLNLYYPMYVTGGGSISNLMEFSNGTPFLVSRKLYRGYFVSSATDLRPSSSDFAESYYFLPLLYSLSKASTSSEIYTFTDEQDVSIGLDPAQTHGDVVQLTNGPDQVLAPLHSTQYQTEANIPAGLLYPGFWSVQNSKGERLNQEIAVNYGPLESDITASTTRDLKNYFSQGIKIYQQDDDISSEIVGRKSFALWKYLVIFVLITLILESIIIHNKNA